MRSDVCVLCHVATIRYPATSIPGMKLLWKVSIRSSGIDDHVAKPHPLKPSPLVTKPAKPQAAARQVDTLQGPQHFSDFISGTYRTVRQTLALQQNGQLQQPWHGTWDNKVCSESARQVAPPSSHLLNYDALDIKFVRFSELANHTEGFKALAVGVMDNEAGASVLHLCISRS